MRACCGYLSERTRLLDLGEDGSFWRADDAVEDMRFSYLQTKPDHQMRFSFWRVKFDSFESIIGDLTCYSVRFGTSSAAVETSVIRCSRSIFSKFDFFKIGTTNVPNPQVCYCRWEMNSAVLTSHVRMRKLISGHHFLQLFLGPSEDRLTHRSSRKKATSALFWNPLATLTDFHLGRATPILILLLCLRLSLTRLRLPETDASPFLLCSIQYVWSFIFTESMYR